MVPKINDQRRTYDGLDMTFNLGRGCIYAAVVAGWFTMTMLNIRNVYRALFAIVAILAITRFSMEYATDKKHSSTHGLARTKYLHEDEEHSSVLFYGFGHATESGGITEEGCGKMFFSTDGVNLKGLRRQCRIARGSFQAVTWIVVLAILAMAYFEYKSERLQPLVYLGMLPVTLAIILDGVFTFMYVQQWQDRWEVYKSEDIGSMLIITATMVACTGVGMMVMTFELIQLYFKEGSSYLRAPMLSEFS